MSKFKVGDRARVVHARTGNLPVGSEVTITDVLSEERINHRLPYNIKVEWDGRIFAVMSWQLEPLTPELGSWEEIARLTKWIPEGVTA